MFDDDRIRELENKVSYLQNLVNQYEQAIVKAYSDPDTRVHLKNVLGKLGVSLPDPIYSTEVERAIKPLQEEIKSLKAKKEEEERERKIKEIESYFHKYGIPVEEAGKVFEYAKTHGILNPETAVKLYKQDVYERAISQSSSFKTFKNPDFMKNPKEALHEFVKKAWNLA